MSTYIDYDGTIHTELTFFEKRCAIAVRCDENCPILYDYYPTRYSEYCSDVKQLIAQYVEKYKLPYESIGNIFEAYFMLKG